MVAPRKSYLDDDDGDGEIVADGQSIRVPLHLCDSLQVAVYRKYETLSDLDAAAHRPRHAELTDEIGQLRAQTRARYLRDLSSAWRGTNKDADDPEAPATAVGKQFDRGRDPAAARAAATTAYDAMVQRNCSAWKTAGRDQQPDSSSRLEEWQRHQAGPRPGTSGEKLDPNAASAVEERLEIERGREGPVDIAKLARDVEARRRKQHAEFSQRLSNAWRRDV
jgi:hypothetical protein